MKPVAGRSHYLTWLVTYCESDGSLPFGQARPTFPFPDGVKELPPELLPLEDELLVVVLLLDEADLVEVVFSGA